jgi:hypothetical protein
VVVAEITDDYMLEQMTKTKPYTFLLLTRGPNWDAPDRDKIIWEHGRRNFALRADGVLAIVCPITDDTPRCGIGIFNATEEETKRIYDEDPAVKAGVMTYEVHAVRSFPGDSLPQ